MIRVNMLQSFGFLLGLVLLPQELSHFRKSFAVDVQGRHRPFIRGGLRARREVPLPSIPDVCAASTEWTHSHLWRSIRNQSFWWEMKRYCALEVLLLQFHLHSSTQLLVLLVYDTIHFGFVTLTLTLTSLGPGCACIQLQPNFYLVLYARSHP